MDDDTPANSAGFFGFLDGINRSSALLGDMWGIRKNLSRHGISLGVQETSEYLGNLTGGSQKGFEYDGLTQVVAQLDTRRSFGHYGGLFNISLLNIHGKNLSADNLQTLQTASGIESTATTRLWEAWYDQKFLDEDRLDVKVGQISIDQEFMVSSNALYFVNTMFGWPALPSYDMPGGGNAYPLSALGARISARPVDGVTVLAGAFNGTPLDHNGNNLHGTSFPWSGGKLYIAEMQFSYPALGSMVEPGQTQPLGWTYRLGAWYNSRDDFAAVSGADVQYKGNYAVYAVADKLVWRDAADPNRTVALFGRVMGTPLTDRNLVDFSMNAGMVFHSPFRNRAADTFGIGTGYAHVSNQAPQQVLQELDSIPRGEAFAELTYQYQLKPWIQIQPDIQYVVNPGAGVIVPDSTTRIKNELVAGVRTNISF
ncbi:carbohydrate porin [Sulfuriferula nivalis]|uniref:Porin n=1 Tax=Sulfuriferula nivalis TaxID=2675298 RepID=A0A809RK09_9PROT|nr:carbohydrate porin [Sulfuriferula nivalis]BBP02279.1 porin [Sulfuriferula nivalis]